MRTIHAEVPVAPSAELDYWRDGVRQAVLAHLAEFVLDHGNFFAVLLSQNMFEQSGFTAS